MAEKYLSYFSDYDPMKKVYWGRLNKAQGKIENAYEMFENVLFSEYSTLNFSFSLMVALALEEDNTAYASFFGRKIEYIVSHF